MEARLEDRVDRKRQSRMARSVPRYFGIGLAAKTRHSGVSRNPARVAQEKLDIGLCWYDAEELIPPSPPAATPRKSVAMDLRYAGERRVSGFSRASGASWIPACAGMTSDCAPTTYPRPCSLH